MDKEATNSFDVADVAYWIRVGAWNYHKHGETPTGKRLASAAQAFWECRVFTLQREETAARRFARHVLLQAHVPNVDCHRCFPVRRGQFASDDPCTLHAAQAFLEETEQ